MGAIPCLPFFLFYCFVRTDYFPNSAFLLSEAYSIDLYFETMLYSQVDPYPIDLDPPGEMRRIRIHGIEQGY